jgi:hypothetical protein
VQGERARRRTDGIGAGRKVHNGTTAVASDSGPSRRVRSARKRDAMSVVTTRQKLPRSLVGPPTGCATADSRQADPDCRGVSTIEARGSPTRC